MNGVMELSDYEKRKEKRLDKILDHLNPEVQRSLSQRDAIYFENIQKAFMWRSKFLSPEQVRKNIMNDCKVSYTIACQIYSDMEYIYGRTADVEKNTLRRILLEHYYTAIQLVMKSTASEFEKSQAIASYSDKIAKLYQLFEAGQSLTPKEVMPATTFVIGGTVNQIVNVPQRYEPHAEED